MGAVLLCSLGCPGCPNPVAQPRFCSATFHIAFFQDHLQGPVTNLWFSTTTYDASDLLKTEVGLEFIRNLLLKALLLMVIKDDSWMCQKGYKISVLECRDLPSPEPSLPKCSVLDAREFPSV